MNAKGAEWCEANMERIVGWLREEASKRRLPIIRCRLPFFPFAVRLLIKRAIRNARNLSQQTNLNTKPI